MSNRQKIQLLTLGIAVLLAAAALTAASNAYASTGTGSWGMSFRENGKPPVIDTTAEFLAKYNAVYLGDTSSKKLYLTFDAGYEAGFTASILDTLKRQEVPAAFFLVGHYISSNPELVRRMCDEGHIVGNHSLRHPDMSKLSGKAEFAKELEELEALYKETTGRDMEKFYRPPEGRYSELNLQHAQELGYTTVFWSLAYADWNRDAQPTGQQAFDKLLPRTHPGAIVLLHSTSRTNSEILDELLTRWKSEGYVFGTLDELRKREGE